MPLGLPKSAPELLENMPDPAAMFIMDLKGRVMSSWPGLTGLSGLVPELMKSVVVLLIMGMDGMS